MSKAKKQPENVLITRFSAIGDVAMTIPSVYSTCAAYPSTRFVMVTRKSMAPIFTNHPDNLVVVGADLKETYKGLRGVRRLFNELCREYNIDAVVDLHNVLRTRYMRLLARFKGIPTVKIHKGRGDKRALTRKTDKVMLQLETSLERYRNTFAAIGFEAPETFNGLFSSGSAPAASFAEIIDTPRGSDQWIGIAPFAKHKGKIYPVDLMEQVVEELSKRPNIKIFLFGGGAEEAAVLGKWAEQYPNVRSLAGERHGFAKELALMSNFDCMVSMDSANMHLASIVGVPVVSVWGATHPYCGFQGWHQCDENIVQLPLTCRPCSVFGNKPCYRNDYLCLAGIKPQIIIDKVNSILDKNSFRQNG